jgi:hypothetical protein
MGMKSRSARSWLGSLTWGWDEPIQNCLTLFDDFSSWGMWSNTLMVAIPFVCKVSINTSK